ncbi:TolB family protein [Streptomyces sp. NPDC021093]|uniref:TolB family protein n=1 Tax=Streptomyces sp. NPDC021093 TaxID=3365112 RepID=UPI00379956FB
MSIAVLAGAMVAVSATSSTAAPTPAAAAAPAATPAAAAAPAAAAPTTAPQAERVTLSSTGKQLQEATSVNGLSADGRYAVFTSGDSGVVPGDTNKQNDVFVRDLSRGTVERVNVASDGTQANGTSHYAEISADGRYVAFMSSATNLVEWPTPPTYAQDVYLHDRRTGRTERVSTTPGGGSAHTFDNLSMSADGRYIAFDASSKQMEGDPKDQNLAYVVDRRTGTAKRISDHIPADWYVFGLNLSADGSHLAYVQRHPRGGRHELWLADLRSGEQKLVNAASDGSPTNGTPAGTSLSADGSLVSYTSFDESTVPGAPSYTWELYLFDSRTGKTRWVTHEGKGELGGGLLSPDGRRLAYMTDDTPGDGPTVNNVHVRDLGTGRTQLVTRTLAGGPQTGGYAAPAAFADKGRLLGFFSTAPDLVPGDTNGVGDGFVRRLRG